MSIPDFQSLMLPVLRQSADVEVRIADIINRLADQFKLTQEERGVRLPSGNQGLFTNRVHWAKFHPSKADLIQNTRRAHLKITELGQTVLASPPKRIELRFLHQYPQFKQFRDRSAQDSGPDDHRVEPAYVNSTQTPDEIMRVAHKQIEDSLAQDLLVRIPKALGITLRGV
jgi:restriction system protein